LGNSTLRYDGEGVGGGGSDREKLTLREVVAMDGVVMSGGKVRQ
jgi:hypothetical protein